MSYHILENLINTLYFCRDGKMRTHINSEILVPERKITSIIDAQNNLIFSELERAMFFYTLINREVIFEEGITFGEFIECLRPWEEQIGLILCKNVKSFFDSVNDSGKYNSEHQYVQVMNSAILSKNIKRKKINWKSENFDINELVNDNNKGNWDGSYNSHEEKNVFSVVNYDGNSEVLWTSIYDGFEGLKNLKLKYVPGMFYFINNEDGIDGGFKDEDLIIKGYKDFKNKYNIIKIKNNFENPTLNEILNGLFYGSSEVYTPVSNVEMSLLDKKNIDKEKLKETKDIYIKEALQVKKIIEKAKNGISNIDFKSIESFDFNHYSIKVESITVYNLRLKLGKK